MTLSISCIAFRVKWMIYNFNCSSVRLERIQWMASLYFQSS